MQFTLSISMDGASFEDGSDDLPIILRQVADRIAHEIPLTGRPVRDVNGNTIGSWEVTA